MQSLSRGRAVSGGAIAVQARYLRGTGGSETLVDDTRVSFDRALPLGYRQPPRENESIQA